MLRVLLFLFSASNAALVPFSYSAYTFGCQPNVGSGSTTAVSLSAGNTAYVCLNINGKVTSIYNVVVDQYTAISVTGMNSANPSGSGYLERGAGWVPSISLNASSSATYHTVFDVSSYGVYSDAPRVYKTVSVAPSSTTSGYLTTTAVTSPIWTVIITLANGVPTQIRWDDGCIFCATNADSCAYGTFDTTGCFATKSNTTVCAPNPDATYSTCFNDMSTCYGVPSLSVAANASATDTNSSLSALIVTPSPSPTVSPTPSNSPLPTANATVSGSNCDLKVFVVWDGTDAKGNILKSVNRRFSVYRAFSVATAYQSALNLAQASINIGSTITNIASSLPGNTMPGADGRRRLEEVMGPAGDHSQVNWALADPPIPGLVLPKGKGEE